MAEILLAKLFGPGGFEQAVVLKRILPHLARQESFASMFLDEANIVARIRHPNVVRVQELGQEGGELFLVMEYLEGESLHGVMRRLASRDERLDHALSAHVIAEACAGLHAAHEMTDPDGNPQQLVHRDVSPQNVFVTYGGAVKLLDFGVATAADRITRTEAGQVKGKYAYMSPEQIDGRPLDRRADIFSLGTVLYELSTERRLFQRATEMLTMRAITDRPIRPPCELVDDYPECLEAVVMRALDRNPDARYQTAAEMRRALLAACRELGVGLAPADELASRMKAIFGDRIEEKRDLLRRLRAGSEVSHVPEAEVDLEVELPSVVHEREDREEPTRATVGALGAASRPSARNRWPVLAAAALVLGAIGVGSWLYVGSTRGEAADARGTGAPVVAREDAVARGVTDTEGEAGGAAGPLRATTGAAGTGAESAEQPATVIVRVETRPPGAVVVVGGDRRGHAPLDVTLVRANVAVVFEARRPGHSPAIERVVPSEDTTVVLRLRRRGPAGPDEPEPEDEEPVIERFH